MTPRTLLLGTLFLLAPDVVLATEPCGRPLAAAPNNQTMLNAVGVSSGTALFAWVDVRDQPYSSIYVQMTDALGKPPSAWPANGLAIGPPASGVYGSPPLMALLSDSLVLIAWVQQGFTPTMYLAEARWASGLMGAPPVVTFHPATTLATGSGLPIAMIRQDDSHAFLLSASTDTPLRTLISRLAAFELEDSAWPPDGVVISDTIPVLPRDMVSDGAGGCYVLVTLSSSCPPFTPCPAELRLHHVLSTGELDSAWPSAGALVTSEPARDLSGRMVADLAGGAYVVWYQMTGDPEVGDSLRVWAQHVDSSGQPHSGWPAGGKQLLYAVDTLQEIADLDVLSTGDLVVLTEVASVIPVLGCWTSDGGLRGGWPTLGRVLIGPQLFGYGSQRHQLLITPSDEILAVWAERVTLGVNAIAGSAVGADGQFLPTWPTGGIRFCESPNQLAAPIIVPGSSGTFLLAWEQVPDAVAAADLRFDHFHVIDGAVPTRLAGRFGTPVLNGRRVEATCHFDGTPLARLLAFRSLDTQPFVPISAPSSVGATTVRVVDEIPNQARRARYFLADSSDVLTDTLDVSLLLPREALQVRAQSPQWEASLIVQVSNPSGEVHAELFDVSGRLTSVSRASPAASGALSSVELRFPGPRTGLYWVRVRDASGRVGVARVISMR